MSLPRNIIDNIGLDWIENKLHSSESFEYAVYSKLALWDGWSKVIKSTIFSDKHLIGVFLDAHYITKLIFLRKNPDMWFEDFFKYSSYKNIACNKNVIIEERGLVVMSIVLATLKCIEGGNEDTRILQNLIYKKLKKSKIRLVIEDILKNTEGKFSLSIKDYTPDDIYSSYLAIRWSHYIKISGRVTESDILGDVEAYISMLGKNAREKLFILESIERFLVHENNNNWPSLKRELDFDRIKYGIEWNRDYLKDWLKDDDDWPEFYKNPQWSCLDIDSFRFFPPPGGLGDVVNRKGKIKRPQTIKVNNQVTERRLIDKNLYNIVKVEIIDVLNKNKLVNLMIIQECKKRTWISKFVNDMMNQFGEEIVRIWTGGDKKKNPSKTKGWILGALYRANVFKTSKAKIAVATYSDNQDNVSQNSYETYIGNRDKPKFDEWVKDYVLNNTPKKK